MSANIFGYPYSVKPRTCLYDYLSCLPACSGILFLHFIKLDSRPLFYSESSGLWALWAPKPLSTNLEVGPHYRKQGQLKHNLSSLLNAGDTDMCHHT